MANPNPSPATRFSKDRQPENRRRPDPLLSAVKAKLSEDDAVAIAERVISDAKAGNLQAVAMLWDRLEGKAIARQEQGEPGEFEALSIGAIRKALKVVS
jgi:hypothetical protein